MSDNTEQKMAEPEENGKQILEGDLALRALNLLAISGFFPAGGQHVLVPCLSLCNAFRDDVPLTRLKTNDSTPPPLLEIVFPNAPWTGTARSRCFKMLPCKRVEAMEVAWKGHRAKQLRRPLSPPIDVQTPTVASMPTQENDLSAIRWPDGGKEVMFCWFSQPIQSVLWPETLERIESSAGCTPEIEGEVNIDNSFFQLMVDELMVDVNWLAGLREIYLGHGLHEPIDKVQWPTGLRRLSMPRFDQPIDGVQLTAGLEAQQFLHQNTIPSRKDGDIGQIIFQSGFNQSISGAGVLPAGLK